MNESVIGQFLPFLWFHDVFATLLPLSDKSQISIWNSINSSLQKLQFERKRSVIARFVQEILAEQWHNSGKKGQNWGIQLFTAFMMSLAKVAGNLWTGNFGNLIFFTFLTIPEMAHIVRAIIL